MKTFIYFFKEQEQMSTPKIIYKLLQCAASIRATKQIIGIAL
jgi:hypothetical protein